MPFVKSETLGCTAKTLTPSEIIAVSGGAWTPTNKASFGAKRSPAGRQFSSMGFLHIPAERFNSGFRADPSTTRDPFDARLYLARPIEPALIQGEVGFPRRL
jgi:hypothetical protein